MDSDNLQRLWQSQELHTSRKVLDEALLARIISNITKSRRRLLRKLYIEIIGGLFIYTGAGLLLFFSQSGEKEVFFALKIMLLTALFAFPSILLLYQSVSGIRMSDFAVPLTIHLTNIVRGMKRSVRVYLYAGLLTCLFIIIALLTDRYFLSQAIWLQAGALLYVVVMAALLSPVLRYVYGKEIKILQQHLEELENS